MDSHIARGQSWEQYALEQEYGSCWLWATEHTSWSVQQQHREHQKVQGDRTQMHTAQIIEIRSDISTSDVMHLPFEDVSVIIDARWSRAGTTDKDSSLQSGTMFCWKRVAAVTATLSYLCEDALMSSQAALMKLACSSCTLTTGWVRVKPAGSIARCTTLRIRFASVRMATTTGQRLALLPN